MKAETRAQGPGSQMSMAADFPSVSRGTDILGLTRDQSRRFAEWLAASYASDPLDAARWSDRELARCAQLSREIGWEAAIRSVIEDSRDVAAAAASSVWRHPTFAELQRLRYGR